MRWPHESAISRRDEHLAATRRLSMWIAGAATAASLGLAAALGFALPGHAASSAARQSNAGSGNRSGPSQRPGQRPGQGARARGGLAPPPQAPVSSGAPPAVSSGGS